MKAPQAGACSNCGSRDPGLRAVYDWRRTSGEEGWAWRGTSRMLCPGCFADPRFGGRWIDERQKATAQKPAWAADEPEEFEKPVPPVRTGPFDVAASPPSASAKPETRAQPQQTAEPSPPGKTKRTPSKSGKSPARRGRKAK